jgi:hypothetical protein
MDINFFNIIRKTPIMRAYLFVIFFGFLAIAGCKKENPTLKGTHSTSNFTYTIKKLPGGDTLPFSNTVIFQNTSIEAFSYLWDFGDLGKSSLANPTHTYGAGASFLVKLTSVGTYGYNISQATVNMESPCDYEPFSILTGCSNRSWSVSPLPNSVKVFSANGDSIVSNAPACLADDQFTFGISGNYNYNSKGQTFVAGDACREAKPNIKRYLMKKGEGIKNASIVLLQDSTGIFPFLGTTHVVTGNSYEILRINEEQMLIQGKLSDGGRVQVLFRNISPSIANIRLDISGGSRKTWILDPTPGANPIIAGSEEAPGKDYAGGPLAPCQLNDEYTFTSTDSVYFNFNGDALIYGGPGDYNCKPFGNINPTSYDLTKVLGTGTGIGQIVLKDGRVNKLTDGKLSFTGNFYIGVMDNAANLYRILELADGKLLIRIGDGTGATQTLKLIAK